MNKLILICPKEQIPLKFIKHLGENYLFYPENFKHPKEQIKYITEYFNNNIGKDITIVSVSPFVIQFVYKYFIDNFQNKFDKIDLFIFENNILIDCKIYEIFQPMTECINNLIWIGKKHQ